MQREDFLQRPVYFGWFVVCAAFVIKFVSVGSIYYSWGSFLKPLAAEFGWTRSQVSLSSTILLVSNAVAFWLVGGLVDKHGARIVVRISALVAGCCFLLLSFTNTLLNFYLITALLGASFAGLGSLPAFAAVSQWFRVRRGLALGISSVGPGAGAMVMVPIVNRLITEMGLHQAFLVLGVVVAGVVLPVSAFFKRPKGEAGEGSRSERSSTSVQSLALGGMSVRQSASTAAFWLLLTGVALFSLAMGGVVTHLMALLTDAGLTVTRAGMVLSAVGGVSMFGRVLSGFLLDRVRTKKYVMVGFNFSLAAAICILMTGHYWVALTLFALLWGLASGAETDTLAYLVGSYFGLAQFGKIFGIMFSVFNLGLGAGSFFMGYVFDTRGNYDWGLGWLAISAAAAAAAMTQIRQPVYDQRLPLSDRSEQIVETRNRATSNRAAVADEI